MNRILKIKLKKITFLVETDHPTYVSHRHITEDSAADYPTAVQEYFFNIQNYRKFQEDDLYVYQHDGVVLKRMGAALKKYTPIYNVTVKQLYEKYPLTAHWLFSASDYREAISIETKHVKYVAQLENLNAIRTDKQE